MPTFLIVSPEPWTVPAVSKHHYALTLASRGHHVLFLNPPTNSSGISMSQVDGTRVRLIDAPPVARGLRYMPTALRRMLEARWLEQLEARSGLRIDAVWLFENSRFYDMGFAGERLKIYHQVDLNQNFHPVAAARSADICFCTTDAILEKLLPSGTPVHKIHHGTPVPLRPLRLDEAQLARFQGNRVNAAYVGNLSMEYLDADLLLATMKAHPQVQFHLIGPCPESHRLRRDSEGLPNIEWWGAQPSDLIPSLLKEVDVVMCTYRASEFREQLASPHKFMEYFASGATIVSTYTDEYKDKRELLCMSDDSKDYAARFSEVVANLQTFNSPALRERRKAFAAMNSYDAQIDRISLLVASDVPQHAVLLGASQGVKTPEMAS